MNYRDKGEEVASDFLIKRGYRVIEHNYRGRDFEIDLIARKGKILAFIEVKRRKNTSFLNPIKSIDTKKKFNIIKGSKFYLLDNDLYSKFDVRYDLIIVIGNDFKVEHYKDIFRL